MSDPATASNQQATKYRYPEELTAAEVAELGQTLPDEVTAHHLRWLETGEGTPWPDSSG